MILIGLSPVVVIREYMEKLWLQIVCGGGEDGV